MKIVAKELFIALALIAFGLFALPAMIYAVGQAVIGPYEAGLTGLYEAIADGLLRRHVFTWLMVLSPYLTIQIFRVWFHLRRPRAKVT
jgi:hypothetical protein